MVKQANFQLDQFFVSPVKFHFLLYPTILMERLSCFPPATEFNPFSILVPRFSAFASKHVSAAPLVWLDIVKNEILQESQKTNSARNWPISPFFSPASHFFMLKGPNSIFKFMKGQPYTLQSLQKGQKLTEYNLFMDRRMHSHTITLFVW